MNTTCPLCGDKEIFKGEHLCIECLQKINRDRHKKEVKKEWKKQLKEKGDEN